MKDFTFWHDALYNSKTALTLKAVGEDLANFQDQSDFLSVGYKLNEAEVAILRKHYSEKMRKFEGEAPPGKPEFKK